MAVDKKGRKLPKGIRQRGQGYEGRLKFETNKQWITKEKRV